MPDNDLSDSNGTTRFGRLQGREPRRDVIGATVSATEKEQVLDALDQAGFASQSHGARVVLLAFMESVVVRDAVAKWFHANIARAA